MIEFPWYVRIWFSIPFLIFLCFLVKYGPFFAVLWRVGLLGEYLAWKWETTPWFEPMFPIF